MRTPSSVISHLHMPIVRLQQQTIMPFIMTQHEHMPPVSILQRFCIMPLEVASSHVQVIFMPPLHFSILSVHRGTIIMLVTPGIPAGAPMAPGPIPGAVIPAIPIPERSTIIAFAIGIHPRMLGVIIPR
jgi:hypothetical protein